MKKKLQGSGVVLENYELKSVAKTRNGPQVNTIRTSVLADRVLIKRSSISKKQFKYLSCRQSNKNC